MQYRRLLLPLLLLVALTVVLAACTRSASTPNPEPEKVAPPTFTPTSIPILVPTKTPTSEEAPVEKPEQVFADVPVADCSIEYLNDYNCLLQKALAWIKQNDIMSLCDNGFCPNEPLTLVELHSSLTRDGAKRQQVNNAINEVFTDQSFGLEVSRGSLSEVFRLVYYPEYSCEYHSYYTDMPEKGGFTCAAEGLIDNGLYLLEDLNSDFIPAEEITRGQFAVILYLQMNEEERLQ